MGTAFFPLFNRGKRSVVLDLAKPEDRDTMHRLLETADVFLENFRDGQLEKQGLGAEELRRRHPHLIVAGHKGFLSGPYEHRPALDEVVQMMSGLAAMTGTKEKPQRVGSSANDIMGGMFGVIAILAALYQKRGGKRDGADIRIGLFENCLFLVAQHMVEYEMTGNKPRSMPEREHAWPIYDIFDAAGDGRIFIGVVTEGHWQSFCREFGLTEFLDDPSLAHHDRSHPGAAADPSARGRDHPAAERGGAVATARRAQHLLLADQPARGSPHRPACAAAGWPRHQHHRRRQTVSCADAAARMERQPFWRRPESRAARRRHVGGPCRDRQQRRHVKSRWETRMSRIETIYPADSVSLREVGLRDGLQLVKKFPSTAAKQRWVREEYAAGVRHFEVGSFLPAKTFPQFVDVREVIGTVEVFPGAHGIALALNERGVNEALESGVGEIASVVSATEEHSQANAHRSRESAIANVKRLCEMRDASAHKPLVNAAISMALGCSITGAVDPKEVLRLVDKCLEAGVDFVAIADTVGYAGPKQVGDLSRAAVKLAGAKPICIHLHDTRGMGIANAAAALDEGVRILDGSLGGLGGCPFAPGATGNVVFEDLVFLCESKGFATGIDLDRLIAVRRILREEMPNEQLYGGVARAGLPGGSAKAA